MIVVAVILLWILLWVYIIRKATVPLQPKRKKRLIDYTLKEEKK